MFHRLITVFAVDLKLF